MSYGLQASPHHGFCLFVLKKTGHKVRPDVTGYLFLFRCRGQFMLNMRSDCGMTNFYSFSAARGRSVS